MRRRINKRRRDTVEAEILMDAAQKGSQHAVRESKALGLTIKLISHRNIIERLSTGETRFVRKINDNSLSATRGLKKGMILCRK